MKKISPWIIACFIGISAFLILQPLFGNGFFDVHDPTSIIRFATLRETLLSGQVPAAWNNQLNNGFGYPLFLYYAPLFTYLGTFLSFVLPTYIVTLKIAMSMLVLTGAVGMYLLMRKQGKAAAIVSSIAYSYLPYHANTLYVRGAYSEATTWVLLPWLLYVWQIPVKGKKQIAASSLVTALFFLSHNVLPFFFLPFLLVWVYLYQKQNLRKTIVSFIFATGIAAWFLFPILFERSFVQAEAIADKTVLADHFLLPLQLWHSPWGYGGSAKLGEPDGMSFMLGKFQIVLAALTTLVYVFRKKMSKLLIFSGASVIIYSFATTVLSGSLWKLIPTLAIIQFPWRLLTFASFGLAVIDGLFITFIRGRNLRIILVIGISALVIFFNLKFFRPERQVVYTDADFVNSEVYATVAENKIPEYLPSWMPTFPHTKSNDGLRHDATAVSGTLTAQVAGDIIIETAYMPQWELRLDGHATPIKPTSTGYIESQKQYASGDYRVELTWHRTVIENAGIIITIMTALLMIGLPI